MCGIVGVLDARPVDRALVERMRDRLAHRGPDAAGLWSSADGRVVLGHRRLSIIDTSAAANQPFLSTDGSLVVTLNGEIYNFRALRRELEREGAAFRTESDTEVLLAAYRRWGADCVERFSGMFAFAIWDYERNVLFCARDRAGEKPFHFLSTGTTFAFASELKALILVPGMSREVDWTSVADFLTFGYVPDPKTVWAGVEKLPPGHRLEVELGPAGARAAESVPYWDMALDADDVGGEDWEQSIRDALRGAAAEMTVADVPVGTFLSGGIDSSAVTAALAAGDRRPTAYTIGFADEDYDERPWASLVAQSLGVDLVSREVNAEDVEAVFRDMMLWHFDEPFNDHSYLPTYYLSREARRDITVALSGDGGDEVFGGYPKYALLARRARIESHLGRPVAQRVAASARGVLPAASALRARLLRYEQSPSELLLATLTTAWAPEELRAAARGPLADALAWYDPLDSVRHHLAAAPPEDVGLVDAMRYLDLKTTLGAGILTKVDRASMAVALEVRPVFLHRDVLQLAGRIPARLLSTGTEAKALLRRAVSPWLPQATLDRRKMGFAMPLGRWLRSGLGAFGSITPDRPVAAIVDPGVVAALRTSHASGDNLTSRLHAVTFLDHWLERWT
jgi:asparagine synthase (glutamine-hydrolysing)